MFSRAQRLSGQTARDVKKYGRALASPRLRLKWVLTRSPLSRISVVVPLAFDKRATRRNRIKRQVREALRPWLAKIFPPVNLMVYINRSAAGRSFGELQHELVGLLKKARLL